MPPILLAVFHCSLYREHISSWGAAGLFQFPLLREGRRGGLKTKIGKKSYFNSRPSARGDERGCGIDVLARVISIHAPPRGATPPTFTPEAEKLRISIHAPPRGATRLYGEREVELHISIHAPPRGATRRSCPRTRKPTLFQFTPLREGRLCTLISTPAVFLFQFTPLREGRPLDIGEVGGENVFQFTPLREGRPLEDVLRTGHLVFQFTPLREGRHDGHSRRDARQISIHAPPRGATNVRGETYTIIKFQFTPLREGRL